MRLRPRPARFMIPALLLLLPAAVAGGQAGPRLGTVDFPTSGSPAAQAHFLRGVLYLHSFEYGPAAGAFREAQRAEPGFAMAYWGEAMTYTHPLWNEQEVAAGRAALARLAPTPAARAAKAPTARERAYLEAVEVLYGEGGKEQRDTAYARAMERLARTWPEDLDAQAFQVLAELSLSQGVRDVPTYVRAGARALALLARQPDHPGAAHYVIHAFDDPVHAPLGLHAARAYSGIAPDAAHAQHMTTHIFLALGLWEDVVSQNRIASDLARWRSGHYGSWYAYGLLQQGRWKEADEILSLAWNGRGEAGPYSPYYRVAMRGHHVVATEQWDHRSLGWAAPAGLDPAAQSMDGFVQGYAALRRGDQAEASRRLAALKELEPRAEQAGDTPNARALPGILRRELEGALRVAAGDTEAGLALLREAATAAAGLPVEYGPPDLLKPPHELLGETLLALGRPAEARGAFTAALYHGPRRSAALFGLARASAAAGDRAGAASAWLSLAENWKRADAEVPGRAEAVREASAAEGGRGSGGSPEQMR